jgi:hypothetical protein
MTMAMNSALTLSGNSGLLPGIIKTVDSLLGGSTGAGTGTGGGAPAGGLLNTGGLDGLIDLKLLSGSAVANLSLFDADRDGDGLISLGLLDKDGDGLVDIDLLNKGVGVSLLDPDGNGLIDVNVLDAVKVSADADLGPDLVDDLLGAGTDPAAYEVVLHGTAGDDRFMIGSKATFVDGQRGLDTVSYGASSDGFKLQSAANGVFVGNGSKVDYLQNVERVMFSDGTLVLDTGAGENAGMAFRLYQAAFDRLPDKEGLKYWIHELDGGRSIASVAGGFLQSPEFQKTYGLQLSNADFVDQLYENVLHRDGEASGMAYWTGRLADGSSSRADVLVGFSESPENVALVGATIDAGLFLT